VGYDAFEGQLGRACRGGRRARRPGSRALPRAGRSARAAEPVRSISTFDVVHDAVDPLGLLRAIRDALRDDG